MSIVNKLRSKAFVLVYKQSIDKKSLISFLEKRLKIAQNKDWFFVVKHEYYMDGNIYTVVYCNLINKPNISFKKLTYSSSYTSITPEILVWNNEYLLRYVLTYFLDFDFETIYTNYSKGEISKYIRILKQESKTVESCKKDPIAETETKTVPESCKKDPIAETETKTVPDQPKKINKSTIHKPMSIKQELKFNNYFNELVQLNKVIEEKNLDKANRTYANFYNFRRYLLTDSQHQKLKEGLDLLQSFKKGLQK